MEISLKIKVEDIARVERELAGMRNAGNRVLARGLNKTLGGVRTDISVEIRKELNVKKATIDKTSRITKAMPDRLTASIESMGQPLPLSSFSGTRQRVKGVSVKVKQNHSRKVIPGTFLATMQSGHTGVFWRMGKKRLPLSQRFSSSVPDVFSNESVMNAVKAKATERLHVNILHELNYELSKWK